MTGPIAAPRRPRRRGLWLLIAAVTALCVVLPGLAAAAVLAIRHHQELTSGWQRPLTVLRVSAPGGEVSILPGRSGRARVEQILTWNFGPRPQVRQAWAGRTLTVTATACGRKPLTRCHVQLVIQVPAGVTVRASAGTGGVSVTGLTGPVHAQVTSGEISLLDLRGPVQATATAGSISGGSLACPQVRAAVGTGSLALAFVLPPVHVTATATTGDVSVTVPPGTRYRVTGSTGSGGLVIAPGLVSPAAPRLITVSTASGNASVGYGFGQPAPQPLPPLAPRPGG